MRMAASRPYAERIRQVIGHLAYANPEYRHPFMVERPVKRVGYIVVSTDRGLCGGLNINLFKVLIKNMKEWHDQKVEVDLCVIGNKGASFFRSFGGNVVAAIGNLGEEPSINDLIGSVKVMLDGFHEGRIDRLYLVSNKFINTMTQKPTLDQLLPGCRRQCRAGEERSVGLPLRAGRPAAAGCPAGSFHRVPGLSGRG